MGRPPTGKPTSFDIAYKAGVSQPTVSRALRGDRSVSEATRKKIEAIARDLNYTVDKNASSLRMQRSNTLALLFFEDPTPDETMINPFFLAMLGAITRACANRGLDLLISFQESTEAWHISYRDSKKADGLILLGYGDYTDYQSRLKDLVDNEAHFVRWGSASPGTIGATVGSDNRGAGRLAGEHLIAKGRKQIAFLGHSDNHYPEFAERYQGMCDAMNAASLAIDPALQADAITTEEAGYIACQSLLENGLSFDAIFAASDLIAIGALRALAEAGRSIPDDVAIIGFDDLPAAKLTNPPLTTVAQDLRAGGEALVETVLQQVNGGKAESRALPAKLIARASTGD